MPNLSTLVDDFNDNVRDTTLWPGTYGSTEEAGGRARLINTSAATAAYHGYQSAAIYTFDDTGWYRVWPQALNGGSTTVFTSITIASAGQPAGTSITMSHNAVTGNLTCSLRVNYSDPTPTSLAYSATDHAWWRIRRSSGNVVFETAPDNAGVPGTATARRTATLPAWADTATDCRLLLESGRQGGTQTASEFDRVTVAAAAPVVNAGADATVTVNTTFTRTATENGSPTSRAWTIFSGPAGSGTTIGTAAALSWTPATTGTYVLRYSATNATGTGTDDVTVTVAAAPASSWDLTSPKLKEAILRFVSTVENGNQQWWTHFGYIEYGAGIGDNRGYTGGIVGWTTGTQDMNVLIKHYRDLKPGNVLEKWIDELDAIDQLPEGQARHEAALSTLGAPFVADWQTAGNDPVFQQAQLNERDRVYWNRAYAAAITDGLSPLGLQHYYDTIVNHGWWEADPGTGGSFNDVVLNAKAVADTPAEGGSEGTYLAAINDRREVILRAWGDWKATEDSPPRRVDALRAFVASGNFGLVAPYSWNMYGTVHTISAWPDPYVLPSAGPVNAVVYRSGSTQGAGGGSALAVSKATGLAVGDLMVSAYVADKDVTSGNLPALAGWQTAGTLDRSATTPDIGALRIAWKVATSTDVAAASTSYPSPGNVDHAAAINVFTAGTFNPSAPIADIQFGVVGTAAFTHTAPSATGVASGMLLNVFTRNDTGNPSATVTWTTTAADLRTQYGSSGMWVGLATATTPLTAAGATGTKSATASDSSMALLASVVIAPAPGAAAGTRNIADYAAATDSFARTLTMVRTASSAAGATDAVTQLRGKNVSSGAGASDSFTRTMTMVRPIVDWAPTTDHAVWTMDRPDIDNYQFVFDTEPWVPFGLGQTVVVQEFNPGGAETRTQDVLSPTSDVRWFGTDRRTPPTWSFDMYTDVLTPGDALGWAQNLEEVWDAEDLRSTPNAVVALRYKVADRIRRVYGRPGNFEIVPSFIRTGRVHMVADFRLAEHTYYDDVEETIRVNTVASNASAGGFTFPITFPLTMGEQGDSPIVEQAVVRGKRPTWIDVTFHGPSLDPWVMIGGQRWQLDAELGAQESIRMSGKPWQTGLQRQDGAWMAGMLGPQARLSQLRLKPGNYPVKYGAYDPTGTSRAEVAWRAAYGTM